VDGQETIKQAVHPRLRITDRHGSGGISVVTTTEGQQLSPSTLTAGVLVLNGHLHGYFNADGAAVGEEDFVQAFGSDANESFSQLNGWFVGEAAEHNVAHLTGLCADGGV
jgi:hypothetical protein